MINTTKHSRTLLASALGLASACVSFAAHAGAPSMINTWDVTVSAVFVESAICDSNGDCTAPTGVTFVDDKNLRWGSGSSGQSGLTITDRPTSSVATNGPAVANIDVTHLNRPITGTTLRSVDILSTLTLKPTDRVLAAFPPENITFGIKFRETPNGDDPCLDGGANGSGVNVNGCADIFVLDKTSLNFPFVVDFDGAGTAFDPQTYFISFFEQTSGLNPLPAAACAAAGVAAGCLGFRTPELTDTTVTFAALITTTPVSIPEPGTLALLGVGLVGGLLGRRRRS